MKRNKILAADVKCFWGLGLDTIKKDREKASRCVMPDLSWFPELHKWTTVKNAAWWSVGLGYVQPFIQLGIGVFNFSRLDLHSLVF